VHLAVANLNPDVLEVLDLAGLKINKPKPRRLSVIMYRLHSTNVSSIGIYPAAATRFSDVPGCSGLWPTQN
jgi:hypothetical protein